MRLSGCFFLVVFSHWLGAIDYCFEIGYYNLDEEELYPNNLFNFSQPLADKTSGFVVVVKPNIYPLLGCE